MYVLDVYLGSTDYQPGQLLGPMFSIYSNYHQLFFYYATTGKVAFSNMLF